MTTTIHPWYFTNNDDNDDKELAKLLDTIVDDRSPNQPDSENLLNEHSELSSEILKQIKSEISSYEVSSPSTSNDSVIVPYKQSPQGYDDFKLPAVKITNGTTQAPTECKVCGLPTNCHHYEVPSCNGCKTFYRRTIIMGKKHECRFKNSCNVRGGSRCRSCRFDQCILAGMDASAIRFPNGFNVESAIQEVNKRKRVLIESNENEKAVIPVKIVPRFEQTIEARIVDNLAYLEMKFRRLRESTFNARNYYTFNVRDLLKSTCELNNADKYEKPLDWPLPPSYFDCSQKLLNGEPRQPCTGRHWLTTDLVLNIEYLKALPFFPDLDIDDQEILIMHVGMVNAVLIQSFYSYLYKAKTLTLPDGRTPILNHRRKSAMLGKDYPGVQQMQMDVFCRNIEPFYRLNIDLEEYSLLKAIIFCHAEAPELSQHAQQILEHHREIYANTLLRRLQARLGTLPGACKYADILALVETFFHFGQKKKEFHVLLCSMRRRNPEIWRMTPPALLERFIIV
ncbi:Transcription factor HNF-4-like protein [Aphelenchoides bicaudatus]|nr:Transcription factor HNF-4-like protein [Aphelenchoides bicaudatus]